MNQEIYSKIVGTTFISNPAILEQVKKDDKLVFVRELENVFDDNAVKVNWNNQQIGYLKKELAREVAPVLDSTAKGFDVKVADVTGGKEGKANIGINIVFVRLKD